MDLKIDPRIPLPNCLRCPALALSRKYNYPDSMLIDAIQDEKMKAYLEKISKVVVELTEDGDIKKYGERTEPEHVTRRLAVKNDSSGNRVCETTESKAE
jgi:hypothetical protein